MWKEGVFSSWKGHRPFMDPMPAGRRGTSSATSTARRERSHTRPTAARRIRPWATASQLRSETGQRSIGRGDVGQGAVEQHVVQAPGGDVGVGGDLVDHHALAGVVIGGAVPQLGEQRVQVGRAGVPQLGVQVADDLLLLLVDGPLGGRGHHVGGGQPLEHGDLHARVLRQDGIAIVAGDGARSVAVRVAVMTERAKRPISWLAMSFRAAEERIEPVNSRTQYGSASRRCSASSRASRGSSGMYQSWTTYSAAARSIGSAKRLRSRVRPVMASSTSWTE